MGCRRWLGFEGGVGVVGQGGSEGLCRFEKITAVEVVTGNVNVGSLSTIRCRGARRRSSMRQIVLIVVRSMFGRHVRGISVAM